jgi:hypothetical protein
MISMEEYWLPLGCGLPCAAESPLPKPVMTRTTAAVRKGKAIECSMEPDDAVTQVCKTRAAIWRYSIAPCTIS